MSAHRLDPSALQSFAESLARYIGALSRDPAEGFRRPFVIEFAGMPNSGKTLCADRLSSLLRRAGFDVRTIPEQAALSPIPDAPDPIFNLWTMLATIERLLESQVGSKDIVVVDRGVADARSWVEWLRSERAISPVESKAVMAFLEMRWWGEADLTFFLTVSPGTALKRDYTHHLSSGNGGIMNRDALVRLERSVRRTVRSHSRGHAYAEIETTRLTPERLIEDVFGRSLLALSDAVDERILAVERVNVENAGLRPGLTTDDTVVRRVLEAVRTKAVFRKRSEVEEDEELIQPIPISYFQYRERLLLLRRKDGSAGDRMFDRYTIWVGGHIRDRDEVASQQDLLVAALRREIFEELNLDGLPRPARHGLVWDPTNSRSAKHFGCVYRVSVKSGAVSVSQSQSELRLTRGASVSGTFQSREQIRRYLDQMEPWSQLLLRSLLST